MIPSEINDPRIRILIVVLDWLTLVDIYDNWHLSCMIMNMSHNYKLNTLLLSWLLLFCLKVRNGLTYSIWKEALFHIMQVVKNYILGIQTHHRRGDVTWRPYQHVHCTLEIKSCLHFAFISSLICYALCLVRLPLLLRPKYYLWLKIDLMKSYLQRPPYIYIAILFSILQLIVSRYSTKYSLFQVLKLNVHVQ